MKTKLTRKEAKERIDEFFNRKEFTSEEVRKIKRLAMKFNIKLGGTRKKFCKKCFSNLKGKTRVSKVYKSVGCFSCGFLNKFKI